MASSAASLAEAGAGAGAGSDTKTAEPDARTISQTTRDNYTILDINEELSEVRTRLNGLLNVTKGFAFLSQVRPATSIVATSYGLLKQHTELTTGEVIAIGSIAGLVIAGVTVFQTIDGATKKILPLFRRRKLRVKIPGGKVATCGISKLVKMVISVILGVLAGIGMAALANSALTFIPELPKDMRIAIMLALVSIGQGANYSGQVCDLLTKMSDSNIQKKLDTDEKLLKVLLRETALSDLPHTIIDTMHFESKPDGKDALVIDNKKNSIAYLLDKLESHLSKTATLLQARTEKHMLYFTDKHSKRNGCVTFITYPVIAALATTGVATNFLAAEIFNSELSFLPESKVLDYILAGLLTAGPCLTNLGYLGQLEGKCRRPKKPALKITYYKTKDNKGKPCCSKTVKAVALTSTGIIPTLLFSYLLRAAQGPYFIPLFSVLAIILMVTKYLPITNLLTADKSASLEELADLYVETFKESTYNNTGRSFTLDELPDAVFKADSIELNIGQDPKVALIKAIQHLEANYNYADSTTAASYATVTAFRPGDHDDDATMAAMEAMEATGVTAAWKQCKFSA